jgi:hypothetical protein
LSVRGDARVHGIEDGGRVLPAESGNFKIPGRRSDGFCTLLFAGLEAVFSKISANTATVGGL